MNPLGFLKQKLQQGLSDVENWGEDVGNDVSHAVSAVFGGNSQSSQNAPQQQQAPVQTANSPTSMGTLQIQNSNQPQQNTTPQTPNNPTPAPTPIAPTSNTVKPLVDFTSPTMKTAGGVGNQNVSGAEQLTNIKNTKQPVQGAATAPSAPAQFQDHTQSSVGPVDALLGAAKATAMLPVNTIEGTVTLPTKELYQQFVEHNQAASNQTEAEAAAKSVQGFGGAAAVPAYFLAKPLAGGNDQQAARNLQILGIKPGTSGGQRAFQIAGEAGGSLAPLGAAEGGAKFLTPSDSVKLAHFGNVLDSVKSGATVDPVQTLLSGSEDAVHANNPMNPGFTPSEEAPAAGDGLTPRDADAERVAQETYQQTGNFDQAVRAYSANSATDPLTAMSETARTLQESNLLTPHDTEGLFGVNALPVDKETEAPHAPKTEGTAVKITSLGNRLRKLGPEGREILQRTKNTEINTARLTQAMKDRTPTFYNLPEEDQELAGAVKEGKATSDSPTIQKAVQELKETFPQIQQGAERSGLDVGNLGETYVPHIYPKGFFDKGDNFANSVQHLVQTGQAPDEATAVQILNRLQNSNNLGPHRFGNLEQSREADVPGYQFNSKTLNQYYEGTARRISEAQHYGPKNELIHSLIARAAKNGNDPEALQEVFNAYHNPPRPGTGPISETGNAVRHALSILQLQKAVLSHLPQGFANTGAEIGFRRYGAAVRNRVFNSGDKDFLDKAGFSAEKDRESSGVGNYTGKLIAPMLKQLRQFHREVAGIGGRDYAEAMAGKGNVDRLRDLGVTGDLETGDDGSIKLNDDQLVQAAHNMADRTIFSDTRMQSPAWTQKELGKYVGQYRTAYTFKQAGFINNLFKEAKNGNVAPLIRYVGIGAPVSGAVVSLSKDLFTGNRPKNAKQAVLDAAAASGAGSVGGGAGDAVENTLRYTYNGDSAWQNVVGSIAPGAGTIVQTGQNVDNAARGNPTAIKKQGLSYVPGSHYIEGSRVGKALGVQPAAPLSPADQKSLNQYESALKQANNSLAPFRNSESNVDKRTAAEFQAFVARNHTPDGKSIQLSTADSEAQWAELYANKKLLDVVQKFEQGLDKHSPAYDLKGNGQLANGQTGSKLQVYADWEKSDPENRTKIEQNNPWLSQTLQDISNQTFSTTNSVAPNGAIKFLNVPGNIEAQMNQVSQLSGIPAAQRTPDQISQLKALENDPTLESWYNRLSQQSNAELSAKGESPIQIAPSLNASQQALFNQYEALPSGTGARSAFIKANQGAWNDIQNVLAQQSLSTAEKQGAVDRLSGEQPSQSFLGAVDSLGNYDISSTKNANGTSSYSLDPAAAYAQSSGSGSGSSSSSKKPLVALPKRPKTHKQSVVRMKRASNKRVKIKKSPKINLKSPGTLKPVQVGKPTQVLKIR